MNAPAAYVHPVPHAVPGRTPAAPLAPELVDALNNLRGIHPGLDLISDGLRLLNHDIPAPSPRQADNLLGALCTVADEHGPDLLDAIEFTLERLADPASNPTLARLAETNPVAAYAITAYATEFTAQLHHLDRRPLANAALTLQTAVDDATTP